MVITKEYFQEHRIKQGKSFKKMAAELGMNRSVLVNQLVKLGLWKRKPRKKFTQKQKDKVALMRASHPYFQSKEHSKKISEHFKDYYAGLTAEARKEKAAKGTKASLARKYTGTKLERSLYRKLKMKGKFVFLRRKIPLENKVITVDILLPYDKIAIEIDGAFLEQPVTGEHIQKTTKRVKENKEILLLRGGYKVIRVKLQVQNVSRNNIVRVSEQVCQLIEEQFVGLKEITVDRDF